MKRLRPLAIWYFDTGWMINLLVITPLMLIPSLPWSLSLLFLNALVGPIMLYIKWGRLIP